MNEDIKYCILCGSTNKASATHCVHCGRDMHKKNSPFKDYLTDHVKDQLGGKAKEGLFSLLQGYLRSHLYGVVLSISIVATGTVYAATATPPVQKVTDVRQAVAALPTATPEATPEASGSPLDAEQIKWLHGYGDELFSNYEIEAERLAHGEAYDETMSLPYNQLLAEEAMENFPFRGVHDLKNGGFLDFEDYENISSLYSLSDNTLVTNPEEFSLEISKQAAAAGYEVFERKSYQFGYDQILNMDDPSSIDPANPPVEPDYKRVFLVSYVGKDDEFYILEDRLIEQK